MDCGHCAFRDKHVSVSRQGTKTLLKLGSELFTKSLNCQNKCRLRRTTDRKKERKKKKKKRKKVSRVCRDKYLPQQMFCRDKHIFCHRFHFCLDKSILSRQKYACLSRQVPPMIAENSPQPKNASDTRNVNVEIIIYLLLTTSVVAFAV